MAGWPPAETEDGRRKPKENENEIEKTLRDKPDYYDRLFKAAYTICGFTHKETLWHLHKHNQEVAKCVSTN